tara:strand:+ start:399 stop:968 length:570 start_codon:yes stop_codon:yes gene_type:complete
MTELQTYIKSYFGIQPNQQQEVAELFKRETLYKGEYYTKVDHYCKKLSFVHSGYIRIYADTPQKEVTQWISGKGHFVTELSSFIFNQRSRFNLQALTDCELFTIHEEDYQKLQVLVPDWQQIEKRFISECFITLENRVFQFLSLSAEDRYDQLYNYDKELFTEVPQQYLASMLGMTPETFSRIRKKKIS